MGRFTTLDYYDKDHEKDLLKSNLVCIVDEEKGGIIAYAIGEEHAQIIVNALQEPTEEEKTKEMLDNFTSMDIDEALEIWNSLDSSNDSDLADDHFDMWEKVEFSFTIKQLAEQI